MRSVHTLLLSGLPCSKATSRMTRANAAGEGMVPCSGLAQHRRVSTVIARLDKASYLRLSQYITAPHHLCSYLLTFELVHLLSLSPYAPSRCFSFPLPSPRSIPHDARRRPLRVFRSRSNGSNHASLTESYSSTPPKDLTTYHPRPIPPCAVFSNRYVTRVTLC
jgi:hypothetical protein